MHKWTFRDLNPPPQKKGNRKGKDVQDMRRQKMENKYREKDEHTESHYFVNPKELREPKP